jgi:hypothetical protein
VRTPTPTSDGRSHARPHRSARLRLLTVAAVGAVVLGIAQPASAAAPTHRLTASITAAQHVVAAGRTVVLRGAVVGTPGQAGRAVTVQQRVHGTRTWHTLRAARTTAAGRVTVRRSALLRSSDFRLRVADATRWVFSPTTTVTVPTSNEVVSTSDASPTAGDTISLTGRTSAGLVGARVRLQRLVAGGWRSISSATVAADGTYTVRSVATASGEQAYRTFVPAAAGRAAAVSAEQDFTVLAWFRLADLTGSAGVSGSGAALTAGRHAIAGTPYLDGIGGTLTQGTSSTLTYALGTTCVAFRSSIGPADTSDPGFFGVFRLRADDDVAIDRTLDKGSVAQVTADITGADVLRITSGALTGNGDPAWGDPEVLCAGV